MTSLGEVLTIARKARGLTQEQVGDLVGVTQVAIARYEAGERDPDEAAVSALADALGVTADLLHHGTRFRGALAADVHMRRQKTTKVSVWRRMEARLNLLRVRSSYLLQAVSIAAEQHIPTFDPEFTRPEDAARMVRAQWRLPLGPVVNLTAWMEAAGCLVFEEDFGTHRIDGLSQWVDAHPVILANLSASPDRLRWTLAHELGHLCLHADAPTDDMEAEANAFAAEFLMPEIEIRSQLHNLNMGKLQELKREWGVSMQALMERAYALKLLTSTQRMSFYKALNARGWKVNEPGSENLIREAPSLPARVGAAMAARGLPDEAIAAAAGCADPSDNPFGPGGRRLRIV
jgi:Zn-dependent peptidase ImmA (M78 family)/DNA-binding XRE family transcriptional regulator